MPIDSAVVGVAALLLGLAGGPQLGPASANLTGVVRDPLGGGVPQGQVDVSCGEVRRRTTTNPSGEFTVRDLPAGSCTVTVIAAAFERQVLAVDPARRQGTLLVTLQIPRLHTEVVVTPAQGWRERERDVPGSISVTSRREFDSRPYRLLPQLLQEEPGVLVQQTTSAQASPIVRGFTGQSNIFLVDGVRLNTASWRVGPSQYASWIPAGAIDRIEVVRGPGSVQYGSDALGAAINVLPATPDLTNGPLRISGSMEGTVASSDRSAGGTAQVAVRGPRAAILFGGGRQQIGELRGGRGLDSHAAVTRYLGLPSTSISERMPATGFEQAGAYAIAQVRPVASLRVHALFMHESQTGASRYDRVLGGQGLYRSGFHPQTLDFGLVRVERPSTLGFDELKATISVNRQADGRFEQARPSATLDSQEAVTLARGYHIQGRRLLGPFQVTAGAERYDESVAAARRITNAAGGLQPARPDIPEGTAYDTTSAYGQMSRDLLAGRVSLRGGLRFGRFHFSTTADPTLGVTPDDVLVQAFTYQTGVVIRVLDGVHLTAQASKGLRAPNASDLGGIGLTGGGGFEITPGRAAALGGVIASGTGAGSVPTGRPVSPLAPETLHAYEAGVKFQRGWLRASVNAFTMESFDSIQRRAVSFSQNVVGESIAGFTIVRQDANSLAYIAEDARPVAVSVNLGRARIAGLEAEARAQLGSRWSLRTYWSMANGRLLDTGEYLRRMPPAMGGVSARWTSSNDLVWIEGAANYARTQLRLNTGDLDDARIGGVRTRSSIASFFNGTASDMGLVRNGILVSTGETLAQVQQRVLGTASSGYLFTSTPGWVVVNLRAGWRLTRDVDVILLGENLLDRNYRLHGSGLDSPGRGAQMRVRYRF
jgi:outer membrane receptor protein involved in Fe transport